MTLSPDGLLDIFKRFIAEGMTLTEARREFDKEQWNEAIRQALDLQGVEHPLFTLAVKESGERMHDNALETQCYELWMAGWVTEENGRDEAWAWYWRRPAKGNRAKGKFFPSTNQAWNALQRDLNTANDQVEARRQ